MAKRDIFLQNWTPDSVNTMTYWQYFNELTEYALNMFEWVNLPDTVDARYIEMQLFYLGYLCFLKDETLGYMALKCTLGGRFNVYNLPTEYHINTASGYRAERTKENAVIIYNNYLHLPTAQRIRMYAYRLMDIQRTIDTNLFNLKTPNIILVPENQRLTFKNIMLKVGANEPFIFGSKDLDISQYQVLKTDCQNHTLELEELKKSTWNEALSFLGINNANTDKRERLITNEVEANNEELEMAREKMLNSRKQACEDINKMFGLHIDVRYRVERPDDFVEGNDISSDESEGEE